MPIVDIPDVGTVEFPDEMPTEEISRHAANLYKTGQQQRVSPNPVVNQPLPADLDLNSNAALKKRQQDAAAEAATADKVSGALEWADFLIRPFAATAENPFGLIGSAAQGAGQVLNAAGNVAGGVVRDVRLGNTMLPNTAAALSGTDIGPSPGGPVGAGLDAAGQAIPMVAGGMALQAAGVPAPVAFGGPMAASALEATGGDVNAALKAGAIGAMIPGVAQVSREAAAAVLGKAVSAGVSTGGNVTEKIAEALAAQGGVQVFMEGMNLLEYVQMTPEQRKDALLQNIVANTAFLAMDVPGVVNRSMSVTRGKMPAGAKAGEIMERLVNDPKALEVMQRAADDFALQATQPRRAGLQVVPPEIQLANVEPQFVDPAMEPFRGQEQRVVEDYVEPSPTETLVRAEEFQERPAPTIEAPPSPPAESRVQPVSAPEAQAPAAARPAEPVQQKAAKGTKEETPAARVRREANEFDKLLLDYGMDAGWVRSPEVLYDETANVKTGHGTASIKAKILRQQELAVVRRRAAQELGSPDFADMGKAEKRAALLPKLKELVDTKFEVPRRQAEEFGKAAEKGPVEVPIAEVKVGDTLNIEGDLVRVVDVSPDGEVTLQDGTRFGRQVLKDGSTIYAEAWKSEAPADAFGPEPSTVPTLKGSQKQGDLLGSGDVEFNLFSERGQDGDRIAQEQAAREAAQREAAAFAAKNQQEFGLNTGNLGAVGMGGAKPGELTGGSGTATSIKNATVDAERARRGLPPAMEPARRTWGKVWDEAMAIVDQQGPVYQDGLIAELQERPRALTDLEDALLLHRQIELQNEYGRATRELAAAYDDAQAFPNRLEAVERYKNIIQSVSDRLQTLYDVNKAVGTETGRGLAARKMLADETFELAQMETALRAAKEGTPLTDAERQQLTQAHNTIQRLQAELDAVQAAAEARRAERRATEAVEDLKAEARKDPEYNPAIVKLAERIVETLERRGAAAEARLKAKFARTSAGVDPTILADVIEMGAGKLARKAMPFAEWAQKMTDALGEAVRPYLQPAWDKLAEHTQKVGRQVAGAKVDEAFKKARVYDEGEKRKRLIESITERAAEDVALEEIAPMVRRLALQFVKNGISSREPLIDAVHSVLVNHFDPEITRREAMDAISGYGRFKPLDPDAAKATLRSLGGQMQQVAKLEDIQARQPLLKTGMERRVVGDEERRLIQQVNEAKRRFGVVTTDPARQLKSAQDAIVARLKNQIADLNFQIAAQARTVRTKTAVEPTPEMTALKAERDRLKGHLDELVPRPGISESQRVAMAERALEADIKIYEDRIAARETGPLRPRSTPLESAKLMELRTRRNELKAQLEEIRAAQNPKLTPEERALKTLKRRMATELAKVNERIAAGDFTPRRRVKEPFMDAEAAALKGKLDQAKTEWRRRLVEEKRKSMSKAERAWDVAKEVTHAQRQFWTSMDFSAVLRQGGLISFAHPGRALSSMGPMFRALSETQANAEWAKIQARPNWTRYQRAKLYLSDPHETSLTKLEEAVRSRWLAKVPGIKQSNQTYTTFLNKLRADSFDAMVASLERKGTPLNDAELRSIADYVNIATGRGDFGRMAGTAEGLAVAFFSPRLLLSRFQYLLGVPALRAPSGRVARAIGAEYGRTLAGFGVMLALGMLAGASVETDETSSDFGKLRIGNTRLDVGAGLLQPLVYLARMMEGRKKTLGGESVPLRGKVPYGSGDAWDVTGQFLRSKFSPSLSTVVDLASGSSVVGEPVTLGTAARDFAVPLSIRSVPELLEDQGVPKGIALQIVAMLGAGVQTIEDPDIRLIVSEMLKGKKGTPEQRDAAKQALTEQIRTNFAPYKPMAEELRQRRQKEGISIAE